MFERIPRRALGLALLSGLLFPVSCANRIGESAQNNESSRYLPFSIPAKSILHDSKKKVFAHYFYPFPLSIDNKPSETDYYSVNFLKAEGEHNKHLAYGGYLRERPIPRPPNPDKNWALENMKREVKMASAIGLDGFFIDIMGTKDGRCAKLDQLLEAARSVSPAFKIALMPDMTCEFQDKPENFFKLLADVHPDPALFRTDDGRIVVAPYCPVKGTAGWWKENIARMEAKGIHIFFVPLFQNWGKYADEFNAISSGYSDWGCANYDPVRADPSPKRCHDLGKLWMAPVRPQDFRPRSSVFWEAANSSLFRSLWYTAISGNSDWVQLVTWNDYSEATEIAPSTGTQYSFYDLTAYYTAWFKTGKAPEINKESFLYFYRTQTLNVQPEKQQGHRFKIIGKPSEQIELLAFMKNPGTLEIEIGGNTYRQDFPAGLNSFKAPASLGKPVFRLVRGGRKILELAGKWEIVDKADFQDFLYRGGSSLREMEIPN